MDSQKNVSTILGSTTNHKGDGKKSFEDAFDIILNDISLILNEKPQCALTSWIKSVVEYNVPNGKKIRGKLVETAFVHLSGETQGKNVEQAQVLGWCVEILQAAFLIADDLMDNGTTRRGQPCWYKVNNMGTIVVNDTLLLENLVYQLVKKHFGSSKLYANLMDLILGVTFKTALGQSLDTRFSLLDGKARYFDLPTMQLYQSIATLKTSYYTIYLPIALAMVLAGFGGADDFHRKDLWKGFQDAALKIGTFFQIQDDYFDCFANKGKTGKEGSDIQEGKCSWLYAKAMELSNPEQKIVLTENYGMAEIKNVSRIKDLYLELDLPNEFSKTQLGFTTDIFMSIEKLDHDLLGKVLDNTFRQIVKRVC